MDVPPRESMTEEQWQEASQANIAAGGLPYNAISRLNEQAERQGTASHIFTSDLSVNELFLTRQCGFEPLGQVMGSSIYHVGWYMGASYNYTWSTGELTMLTQPLYAVRHLAMNRLQQEAKILGATGVVGVRISQMTYEWGEGLIEFACVGTAVREINMPPLAEGVMPFVSGLSGQEHFALRQGGYRPCGFCMGNCTWFRLASYQTYQATGGGFMTSWANQELTDYTQAAYIAREVAMDRMQSEATAVGSAGVVGVRVDMSHEAVELQNYRGLLLHFSSFGTCITRDLTPAKNISAGPTVLLTH